jgi:hypothetical protein
MPTCSPNLTHSLLTVYKIITFKVEEFFFSLSTKGGQQSFGGLKNHFLEFTILFLVDLGTCPQNLILTQGVEPVNFLFMACVVKLAAH